MPQFDVHRNVGRNAKGIPFLVVLQNARYDRSATRLVAPLAAAEPSDADHPLSPVFTILGQRLWLDVFGLASIPFRSLGEVVASLAADGERERVTRALDELVSTA